MKKIAKKMVVLLTLTCMIVGGVVGCKGSVSTRNVELLISAAASLTEVMGELEALYESKNPNVDLTFTFASSGTLQTQIEEGADVDVFLSAGKKQMDALASQELILEGSYLDLLENKMVLIIPKGSDLKIDSFEDLVSDGVELVAYGNPESVPAGQYAFQVFEFLEIADVISAKANYGSDVKQVLAWVESGAVDCGIVYSTDAMTSDMITIVAEAPEGSHDPIIYPAALIADTSNVDAAYDFLDFLSTEEAAVIFESYGFTLYQ